MKGNLSAFFMALGFMAFIFAMYPKQPAPEYTPGMGYLEEDRAALTAIMEELCGDNEGRFDCGYSPALVPPDRKPMRG